MSFLRFQILNKNCPNYQPNLFHNNTITVPFDRGWRTRYREGKKDLLSPQIFLNNHSHNLHYGASVPAGWQLCHIQDIASVELGKTLDRLKNSGEEKPYLCALNVKWDTFDLSTVKTIRIASSEKERYAVKPGDLLVCEGGDVGRAAIWTEHIEMYYQNALHRIRFKTQDICQEFFLYVLRNYKDRGIIDDVCKGVTIKHFTGQVFRSLDLPIPPLKEQKRIIDSVNAYCNILEKIAAGIK